MRRGQARPPPAVRPAQQARERQRSAGLPPRQPELRLLPQKDPEDPYDERLQEELYLAPAVQGRLLADLAMTVERAVQQAVRPLAEQVQDSGTWVRRLAQVHNELINGLDSRLQDLELLCQQVGGLKRQLVHLESVLRLQEQRPQQPPGASAPSQQQGSEAAGQGARAGGPALADALEPMQAALARVEAKLAPMEAALAREQVRAVLARVEERLASMDAALPRQGLWSNAAAEAALARIEAKLAPAEAELARQEAALARPLASTAGKLPAQALAASSSSRGTDGPIWETSASVGQGSLTGEMVLAAGGTTPLRTQAAHQPQEGEPDDLQHGPCAAVQRSDSRKLSKKSNQSLDATGGKFFRPMSFRSEGEATTEMDRPTFFGIEYAELRHIHDTSSSRVQKALTGAALRWMDWILSFQEPERKGCLAQVIESKCFEAIVLALIVVNAGFMLYMTDSSMAWALDGQAPTETGIGWVESLEVAFLSAYALEVIVKLTVHRLYYFVNSDMNWNNFDFVLMVLALGDFILTNIAEAQVHVNVLVLRSLRILKLARILRVLRVVRAFDALRLMLGSLIGSFISLIWSLVVMGFVYYIFGLFFVQSLTNFVAENGDGLDPGLRRDIMANFGTVTTAMLSLLKATTGGNDWSLYFGILEPTGWAVPTLFIFFMCFVQISLLNILTAVFIDNAMRLVEPDTIAQAKEDHQKELADAAELRRMCSVMDYDGSGTVSASEFHAHLSTIEMRCCFKVLGLDIKHTQEFFELLRYAEGGEEVDIETFVQGCMQMRGAATGIAQQKLMMQAHLLRETQKEHFGKLSKMLDIVAVHLQLPGFSETRPAALSPSPGGP